MTTHSLTQRPLEQEPTLIERALMAVTAGLGLFLLAVVTVILGYQIAYLGRVFPGVSMAGADLSGVRRTQIDELMVEEFRYVDEGQILFTYEGDYWLHSPGELGLSLDAQGSAEAAYRMGRRGWPWERLATQYLAWRDGVSLSPQLTYDGNIAQTSLDRIAAQINRATVEASLSTNSLEVIVQPGQIGRTVNSMLTLSTMENYLLNMMNGEVPVIVEEHPPAILDVSEQAEIARNILSQATTLTVPGEGENEAGPWMFEPNRLAEMLTIERVEYEGGARYQVGLEAEQLRTFLEGIAPNLVIDQPENSRFIFNDDTQQLEVIKPAVIGRVLEVEDTIEHINQQLAAGEHEIELQFAYTYPAVTDEMSGEELGITELVSEQTTYFYGSSAARKHNIATAAAQFHGLLVPPGATFSMVENIGDISLDSGYAEALIIFGDRTIKGVGGGVCQVSTTLFRTVFFGGFPIVERYPHSYRVYYYEQNEWGGINTNLAGLDATVYAPIVDFKFKNDTPYWLLMETYVYNNSITWKFYSTSDGRSVEWQSSGLKNRVDPPDPVYEENSEFAKGQTKQVDWEAEGADVAIYRTVYRDGEVLHEDTINTHYRAWAAVCQYGPGTKGYPPDKPQSAEEFCK